MNRMLEREMLEGRQDRPGIFPNTKAASGSRVPPRPPASNNGMLHAQPVPPTVDVDGEFRRPTSRGGQGRLPKF
jgi:hypothetical protein